MFFQNDVCKGLSQTSLGPVVNILAIFSDANTLKTYNIKGIGCPLLISINILTKKRKNKKEEKMIRLEPRLVTNI